MKIKSFLLICGIYISLIFTKGFANQVRIMDAHFSLAFSTGSSLSLHYYSESEMTSLPLWELFSASEGFIKQEIHPILSDSNTRSEKLREYLSYGASLLSVLEREKNLINLQHQTLLSDYQQCEKQLTRTNADLEQAMKTNDGKLFAQAVELARDSRICMGELQVLTRANRNLDIKLRRYISLIGMKNSYLERNRDQLINYYEILEPSLLKELYALAQQLEQREKTKF